jgi:hypothetical protein
MDFKNITVSQHALQPSDSPLSQWTGSAPEAVTLSAGHVKEHGRRAFLTDTLFERDAIISLRDGHTLRADIFRPVSVDDARVPALVVWSPYGKTGTGASSFVSDSAYAEPADNPFYQGNSTLISSKVGQVSLRAPHLVTRALRLRIPLNGRLVVMPL